MKFCFLDFEFRGTAERDLDLVSVAIRCVADKVETYVREFWLFEGHERARCKAFLRRVMDEGYIFVSYAMEAEARALFTLFPDLRPKDFSFRAIDLYLEYRCLLNHNHSLAYGLQLIDGRIVKTSPPPSKWDTRPIAGANHSKPSYGLAAACFKLLGARIDTDEKERIRRIIIDGDRGEVIRERAAIQAYNRSDIRYLAELLNKISHVFRSHGFLLEAWLSAAYQRGDYAVRTAWMTRLGYPINGGKVSAFTRSIPEIMNSSIEAVLEAAPDVEAFRRHKKTGKYSANEKNIKAWIEAQGKPYWRKTDGGDVSLAREAFEDWYDSRSPGFAGAYLRHLKTKQSLNGFIAGGKKGVFSDFVGRDGRARPYFGIYGSQSSRSQPGATGFIPLKSHWMRNFIEPRRGRACAGIDYASQEFLIAALISQDEAMIQAYASGDVYLAFAKAAGIVPPEATKKTHGPQRELAKAAVLGISYDMTARGLAPRLEAASGRPCSEDEAQGIIDKFYTAYPQYAEWKQETIEAYAYPNSDAYDGYLQLPDGWVIWGDNPNPRSVGNFPIQGHGAVIMREAVRRAQDDGLDVIFTLHDALYLEFDSYNTIQIERLMIHMQDAFRIIMARYGKTIPIRLEGEAWSPDYATRLPSETIDKVTFLPEYVDEKGKADLERYRKFFTSQDCIGELHDGISKSGRVAEVL